MYKTSTNENIPNSHYFYTEFKEEISWYIHKIISDLINALAYLNDENAFQYFLYVILKI